MRLSITLAFRFCLLWLVTSAFAGGDGDAVQANIYLKEYLKQVNQKYPFSNWEKQLTKTRADLDRSRSHFALSNPPFEQAMYLSLESLSRDVQDITRHRVEANGLIRELYAFNLVSRVEGMFSNDGKQWDPGSKLTFQKNLMGYEAGSLKPKSIFLANVASLDRDFKVLQTNLLFSFAKGFLSRRVEEHLRTFNFAKIEALYDDYSLQLDYWSKQIQANAIQTQEQLASLNKKYEENKLWLRQNLQNLVEVLNTDMLYSDLLEYASKQKVELTLEVEEKIETSLKEQNQVTMAPIQERILLWKNFTSMLREKLNLAQIQAQNQKSQSLAKAENDKQEQERLDALKTEQQQMEETQKAKFKQTLAELRAFTFKGENSVELDADSKKALSTKAGFLKTSYVRTGVNKLKVEKSKFSDTLAIVEKFHVEDRQVDFSKMSLQERSNQSAYTYTSPEGRTSQGDLANFVSEVALGSFSSFYSFLSYVTPKQWGLDKRVLWSPERIGEKVVQDREFSYVDLVVDAHRKRSSTPTRGESTNNLPANLIIIFNPAGAILRFQPFGSIDQVTIHPNDLIDGKLNYKFLNYSTDRQHIYLNGIDGEMKIGIPSGKS